MIYKGYFRNKGDNDLFEVEITTPDTITTTGTTTGVTSGTTTPMTPASVDADVDTDAEGNIIPPTTALQQTITLGGTPFTTSMSSNSTIYAPIKYIKGTIEIVHDKLLTDIYNPTATKVKCKVSKGDKVVFSGFVAPSAYDQGYTKRRESISVDVVDGLSVLQYIPYTAPTKEIKSFREVIDKVLSQCKCYKTFAVSDNLRVNADDVDAPILDNLYLSEALFFDTKTDSKQTDNDVAWKCSEVLEEICRYLQLTAIAEGDTVYFLDYDAIRQGNNNYYTYTIGSVDDPYYNEYQYFKEITASDYSGNNTKLSLDKVYNKISVKAEYSKVSDLLPDPFDKTDIINITARDTALENETDFKHKDSYGELVETVEDSNSTNNKMLAFIGKVWNEEKNRPSENVNAVFVKYYKNPKWKFYHYRYNNTTKQFVETSEYDNALNYTQTKTLFGAQLAKFSVNTLKSDNLGNVDRFVEGIQQDNAIDYMLQKEGVTSVSLQNYIELLRPRNIPMVIGNFTAVDLTDEICKTLPFFETELNTSDSVLFGGDNAYLMISGTYQFHSEESGDRNKTYPIPQEDGQVDPSNGKYHCIDNNQLYLFAKLQIGNLYWNGTDWDNNANNIFQIHFFPTTATTDERRYDAMLCKSFEIRNTVYWRTGVTDKGYQIKMPSTHLLTGHAKLTVYCPPAPQFWKMAVNNARVFLKDFSIKAVCGDKSFEGSVNDDTTYTMLIDDANIEKLTEIKVKVNTYDDKNTNKNSVSILAGNNNQFQFLDNIYNSALANDKETKGKELRNEHYICYRHWKQYNTQRIKMKVPLRNDLEVYGIYAFSYFQGKKFIVDTINRDYKNNSSVATLIEKA
jgi:hypothetical protein